ncbi:MAG: hypothetical protein NZ602_12220 [Thermoguttaceae bacterium]|nr:hypothetical protein [Thermoguttaceae bacterium]MDW8037478.1 hypothetical protein [Thermoguttaceae bacterium]
MSSAFNPYYKWLGILPEEQPPSYYRLLGIPEFEEDVQIIESAADRQMTYIKTFQTGPHSAESQKILNELATARACLLDPAKKAAYDAHLRAIRNASGSPEPKLFTPPMRTDISPGGMPHIPGISSVSDRVGRHCSPLANVALLGIVVLFLMAGLVVFSLGNRSSQQVAEGLSKEKDPPTKKEKTSPEVTGNFSPKQKDQLQPPQPTPPPGGATISSPLPSLDSKASSGIPSKDVKIQPRPYASDLSAAFPTAAAEENERFEKTPHSLRSPPSELLSPPSTEELHRLEKELRNLFEIENVKTPAQAKATAERLLQALADPSLSAETRYILRLLAGQMFAQANLAGKMWEQWAELVSSYDCDGQLVLETMFQGPPLGVLFVTKAVVLAGPYLEQVYKKSRFPAVLGALKALGSLAQQNRATVALECLKAAEKTLKEFMPFWKAYETAQKQEKRHTWAEWVCFGMGNWEEGLLLLKEHPDWQLQELAITEIEQTSNDGPTLVAIADRWARYAETLPAGPKRKAILAHVQSLYERALHPLNAGKLSSLDKVRLQRRLDSVRKESLPKFGPKLMADLSGGESLKGKWIELLPLIDLPHAVVRGSVESKKGSILLPLRSHLQLPISTSGSYEVVVIFSRLSGNDSFGVGLPVGSRSIQAVLSFWYGRIDGLQPIDNQPADKNPSGRKGTVIKYNVPYRWVLKVQVDGEKCRISSFLNNKPLTEWEGPLSSLASNTSVLDIGNWDSSQVIHSFQFRAADDQAQLRFTER